MILGFLKSILMFLNLLVISTLVVVVGLLRLIPIQPWQKLLTPVLYDFLTPLWINTNSFLMAFGSNTQWEIHKNGELKLNGWYFLVSNHTSWADILVLQKVFNRKIPMLKFFMKRELLWTLPIGGLGCWLMDFPVMHRRSKEYIKKHPKQRSRDIETTRKACEKFKNQPVTIINFLEGTRFTSEKHQNRRSPYQHLLSPKAGGIAFTLATMEGVLHDIIDVTIIYQPKQISLWDILCNKAKKIIVHYDVIPIPPELRGDYYNDKAFKRQFQQWLNQRWKEKDELITQLTGEN